MPADRLEPSDLAHEARNVLAVALGRLQLLRRQAERGETDQASLRTACAEAETRLRRLAYLIDALEDAVDAAAPAAVRALPRPAA